MMSNLPPGALLILGALLLPLMRGPTRQVYLFVLPILSFVHLMAQPFGTACSIQVFDYTLTLIRIDKLSLLFGIIFHISAWISVIYAIHVKDTIQHIAGLIYAGSVIAATFAGDLIALLVFCELATIASAFLIWAVRTESSYRAGMRYFTVLVISGLLLMVGIILHFQQTGDIQFGYLGLKNTGTKLILLAFGIKCAFPFLHNWLVDAYPEATPTGSVFLSAFTTKLAVYVLIRGFPGTEILIWIGAGMAVYGVIYAVLENDMRRILAYHIMSQVGYMVAGIGIGTKLALNGAAAHAFAHILYKGLLFMGAGAVIHMTGKGKLSELGGLYKTMPLTFILYMVGGLSISGFPLFSGFATKSLVVTAVAENHHQVIWFMLTLASVGTFLHTGLKLPYFAFFAEDSGIRVSEPPRNMLWGMGLAACLCVTIGLFPKMLYNLLPFPIQYEPYTVTHVITQLQLLAFTALAFVVLIRTSLYPQELDAVNLDTDWFYRRLPKIFWEKIGLSLAKKFDSMRPPSWDELTQSLTVPLQPFRLSQTVLVTLVMLLAYLLINIWYRGW